MNTIIAVEAATKRYRDVTAVDTVSLTVDQGEIYALLGLNGAGKTTLIRMLVGMIRPTAGRVSLFGAPVTPRAPRIWSQVGYLVETAAAYPDLTVRENLDVVRRLRRIANRDAVSEAIERLSLTEYADRRARTLSLGNAQRLGLAKALLHQPRLLILDEPANGLDPAGVVEIRELLQSLTAAGTTVLLSSHILAEVARLATRIVIIHGGQLREEFDTAALGRRFDRWLSLATRDDDRAAAALAAQGYQITYATGGLLCRDDHAVERPDDVATALVGAGCPPVRLVVEHEDLEEYFLRSVEAGDA